MPAIIAVLWPLLLTILQSLVSYLLGRGVFESLLLAGIRRYCKRWPNATVIELAIAWADSVGKRHLLGDLQVPPEASSRAAPRSDRGQGGFTTGAFMALICIVGAALVIGYAAGVHHAQGEPSPVIATPQRELPGGGLKLATEPDANAKPARPVVAGSKVAAVGQVKVRPKPVKPGAASEAGEVSPPGLCSCEEVTVDYTVTADANGQSGIQASSDDGEITGGHHTPVIGPFNRKQLPWAVGVTHGLTNESGDWGIAVDRDWSVIRGSVDLFQDGDRIGGRAGVLLRF